MTHQPDAELPDAELPDAELPDAELPDAELPDAELPDALHTEGRLCVAGFDAQDDHLVSLDVLCRIGVAVLVGEAVGEGRVDLHLVDQDTITDLNAEHMGGAGPTDVLSFPLDEDPFDAPNDALPLVGDIVLCPVIAHHQAAEHAGTFDAELALLVVHGVLHLLGHDHAEPQETLIMQARERHYLAGIGHHHPVRVAESEKPEQ